MLQKIMHAIDNFETAHREDAIIIALDPYIMDLLVYIVTNDNYDFNRLMERLKDAPVYNRETHQWEPHTYSITNNEKDGASHSIIHEEMFIIDTPMNDPISLSNMIHELEGAGYHLDSATLVSVNDTSSSD